MILVVKLGGSVLGEAELQRKLCHQIARLGQDKHELVVVHGGGQQLTDLSQRLGDPIIRHQGRRVHPDTSHYLIRILSGSDSNTSLRKN